MEDGLPLGQVEIDEHRVLTTLAFDLPAIPIRAARVLSILSDGSPYRRSAIPGRFGLGTLLKIAEALGALPTWLVRAARQLHLSTLVRRLLN